VTEPESKPDADGAAATLDPVPNPEALAAALRTAHGLDVVELERVEDGADAAAVSFRLRTRDGSGWFVKLRPNARPAAVLIPRYLHDQGVPEVVASIPTRDGTPWLRIGTWSVFVSPLVHAPSVMRAGMSLDGWRRFGEIAARIHATRLPDELSALLATETFEPRMTALARTVDRHVGDGDDPTDDPLAASVRARWQAERPAILHLVGLAESLGARIRDRQAGGMPVPFVLCHADLHAANVLVVPDGALSIVDWDELLLAPRERDLMFVRDSVVAHVVTPDEADAFEAGYGPIEVDPLLIAWYRVDWAVQDLAGFAHEVLLDPARDPADRRRAAAFFEGHFGPDGEVPWALAAERSLAAGER
jgi:spectinomycin phosphotransferase